MLTQLIFSIILLIFFCASMLLLVVLMQIFIKTLEAWILILKTTTSMETDRKNPRQAEKKRKQENCKTPYNDSKNDKEPNIDDGDDQPCTQSMSIEVWWKKNKVNRTTSNDEKNVTWRTRKRRIQTGLLRCRAAYFGVRLKGMPYTRYNQFSNQWMYVVFK